jgi:hypothetical protein
MKRLYTVMTPGRHPEADHLVFRVPQGELQGSGVTPDGQAFVQLSCSSDAEAIESTKMIVGMSSWAIRTGYGIHRRIVAISPALGD